VEVDSVRSYGTYRAVLGKWQGYGLCVFPINSDREWWVLYVTARPAASLMLVSVQFASLISHALSDIVIGRWPVRTGCIEGLAVKPRLDDEDVSSTEI
jgi:hypothetical protein